MPTAVITGSVVDARKRLRFVPRDALVTSCRDPKVVVINQEGHFFIPNLEAGQTYEFMIRNGAVVKNWRFTPKAGHNRVLLSVPTKPARATQTKERARPALVGKAGA